MSEIVDDFKISNVEITNELGINLTSDTSRIKHTGNDVFNITSSGEINIRTENKNGGNDCDINLYAGNGLDGDEGGDIRLEAGDGDDDGGDIEIKSGAGVNGDGGYIEMYAGNSINVDGGHIEIISGNGGDEGGYISIIAGDGNNDNGGNINITAGDSTNYSGGDIYIDGGDGKLNGGDVFIEGGQKTGLNGNKGSTVQIVGGFASGTTALGGDINIYAGYGEAGYGDIRISGGFAQKIGFFGNDPVIRPSSTNETNGVSTPGGGANLRHDSTFTGNVGDKAYTISDIVKALKQLGFLDSDVALPGLAPAALSEPRVSRKEQNQNEINAKKAEKNSTEDN
jgi:hypothetical protein